MLLRVLTRKIALAGPEPIQAIILGLLPESSLADFPSTPEQTRIAVPKPTSRQRMRGDARSQPPAVVKVLVLHQTSTRCNASINLCRCSQPSAQPVSHRGVGCAESLRF